MKLSCTQENLNKKIAMVSRIVPSRSTLPILSNILFSTENGRLKIASTDLEVAITTYIGVKVEKEGSITIPAKLLTDFITTNKDKNIILETKDNTLFLKSEKHQAHIKGINAEDFPSIPKLKKNNAFILKSQILKKAFSQVIFSCSIDESRPVLNGIFFKVENDILKIVATDSYRLAEKTIKLTSKLENNFNVIIPQKSAIELIRILPDQDEDVEIIVGENQIQFSFSLTEFVSRLIEGEFPDYTQIIPKEITTNIEISTQELTSSIKMASFFAYESANNIKINIKKESLEIIAVSPQLGDNLSTLSAKISGGETEIAFNAKFMLDFLNGFNEENIKIEVADKLAPVIFKSIKNNDYIYIIMPLRIEE